MAVDEALAEAVAAGVSPPVLRLYRWTPPCLSLGASQPYQVADAEFCRARGVELVRRPTGGRAVLHHLELTYLVAAPLGVPPWGRDLQGAYAGVCRAVVAGLRRLGVAAEVAPPAPAAALIHPTQPVPCFVGPAPGEIVVAGRKLVGSAMRRVGEAILQHGSILEGWDGELQAGCLGLPSDQELRRAVVTLQGILGTAPSQEQLAEALAAGFTEVLGAILEASAPTPREEARATALCQGRYANPSWTVQRCWQDGGGILARSG